MFEDVYEWINLTRWHKSQHRAPEPMLGCEYTGCVSAAAVEAVAYSRDEVDESM